MAVEGHDSAADRHSDADSPASAGRKVFVDAQTEPSSEPGVSTFWSTVGSSHPRTIGQYRILSVLGQGGMGLVYEAEQQHPRRAVALKVVRSERYVDPNYIRLFQREAQTLARLRHPSVAAIYQSGCTEDGHHFFAMELVRGVPLNRYVRAQRLGLRARLELFGRICEAINYAHQRGVIHRDLKPSNILIDTEGHPKVLDFGLARITDLDIAVTSVVTEVGQIRGTLAYMSPEQARGNPDEIDLRSDVYSLGVLLFELLTERLPYQIEGSALHEAVRTICEQAPPKPSTLNRGLRGDLETVTLKALAKEPARRYQSAAAMGEDLERFLANQPILARPPSAVYQFRKLVARHKAGSAFVAALFVLVASFGVWMRVLYQRASYEAETANWVKGFMVDLFRISDPNEARGKSVTARQLLDRGAEKITSQFQGPPAIQAELTDTMATAYRHLGLYKDAAELARRALQDRRREFGEQHPSVAESMMELGWVLKKDGAYPAAEQYIRKSLALHQRLLGPEHPKVAENLHLLGTTRREQGDYAEAEQLLRQALDIRRKVLGGNHAEVANGLVDLADVLRELGDYQEAVNLARQAMAIRRRLPDADHPHLASAQSLLASLLREEGNYAEAAALARDALALRQKYYDDDHPLVAASLVRLGGLLRDQRVYDAAYSLLRQALEAYGQRPPPDQRSVAAVRKQLGWVLFDTGDCAGAEAEFGRALEIYRARAGHQRRRFGEAALGLAQVRLAQGHPEHAEELLREVLALSREVQSDLTWLTSSARSVLGSCLAALGRYDEAEPLALESYEAMRRIRGPEDRYVLEALQRIADLYEAQGELDKAAEWRARLPATSEAHPPSEPAGPLEDAGRAAGSQASTARAGLHLGRASLEPLTRFLLG